MSTIMTVYMILGTLSDFFLFIRLRCLLLNTRTKYYFNKCDLLIVEGHTMTCNCSHLFPLVFMDSFRNDNHITSP